ncbi:hypothetical protein Zmor_010801 [Zophobas morio]|uniref:Transposase Tc1-like domain-containing protein n=1 Tax=Zophobas morio TaxID=2755281 RepID=A0AA38MK82_9CUCU|nr:hypothetical protein Zmor_010801 [Zophobas morio]
MTKVVALYDGNRSAHYIANALNLTNNTVHDALRRFQESGTDNRRQASGRKRCATGREDRFMLLSVLRNPRTTSNIVVLRLRNLNGTIVSARTVCRKLRENHISPRKPAMDPKQLAAAAD